jgi:hypothetical protein
MPKRHGGGRRRGVIGVRLFCLRSGMPRPVRPAFYETLPVGNVSLRGRRQPASTSRTGCLLGPPRGRRFDSMSQEMSYPPRAPRAATHNTHCGSRVCARGPRLRLCRDEERREAALDDFGDLHVEENDVDGAAHAPCAQQDGQRAARCRASGGRGVSTTGLSIVGLGEGLDLGRWPTRRRAREGWQ